jgi:hypothetical protein
MGNYLLAYRGGRMGETDAEREEQMAAWVKWFEDLGGAIVDPGNPFSASASVGEDGNVDGQAASGLGGYSVLQAGSLGDATELAKGSPVLRYGGSVDVYETMVVM